MPDAVMERYIWFNRDELNSGMVLAFIPLDENTAPIGKPVVMGLAESRGHFDFLKGSQPDENGQFQLDGTGLQFRFAMDREPDGAPDLAVFEASEEYTRTYLLGRDQGKWFIIWVGYPL